MAGAKLYDLDDFGGGLDTRDAVFTRRENTFRVHENVYTTNGRKLRKRPPIRCANAALNSSTKGLASIGGALYTFAPRGSTVTTTPVNGDTSVTVTVLEFDVPGGAIGGAQWTLHDWVVFDGVICAAISHAMNCTAHSLWTLLHVFDGAAAPKFTYVDDPYVPSEFSPSIADPQATYTSGYAPRLAVVAGKLWMSRVDGSVAFSLTGNPRVWNTRGANDLLDSGIEFAQVIEDHTAGDSVTFTMPVAVSDLAHSWLAPNLTYKNWTYVLQYHDGTDWATFAWAGSGGISNDLEYERGTDADGRRTFTLRWDAATSGGVVRLKVIARRVGEVVSGLVIADSGVAGTFDYTAGVWSAWNYTAASPGGGSFAVPAVDGYYLVSTVSGLTAPYPDIGYPERSTSESPTGVLISEIGAALPSPGDGYHEVPRYERGIMTTIVRLNAGANSVFEDAVRPDDAWHANNDVAVGLIAGEDDAGWVEPQSVAPVDGQVTAMTTVRNRLAIHYERGVVLYAVDPEPTNMQFLDYQPMGWDGNGRSVAVADLAVFPSDAGMRGFNLSGDVNPFMTDRSVGEPLEGSAELSAYDGCYWSKMGLILFSGTDSADPGNPPFIYVLKISRESRIVSWAKWTQDADLGVSLGGSNRNLNPIDDRLYFRHGNNVYWFDAQGDTVPGRDHKPGAASVDAYAYTAIGELNMTPLGAPGRMKELFALRIAQEGSCTYKIQGLPFDRDELVAGATLTGTTYGQDAAALAGVYQGVALRFESSDEAAWELHGITLEFKPWRAA